MTVLEAFQTVAGMRVVPFPAKFEEICDMLKVARLDYWRSPNVDIRGHMVYLAEQGLFIYEALSKAEPEYMI